MPVILILFIDFDCDAALKSIKRYYLEIINLPIDSMIALLYEKQVITHKEKTKIKAIMPPSDRMEYVLDNIIVPSLEVGVSVKFERFLEVIKIKDAKLERQLSKLIVY